MNRLFKPLGFLVLAQAVCLISGLWIHDHYLLGTARWDAEARAWDSLSELVQQSHDFSTPWTNKDVHRLQVNNEWEVLSVAETESAPDFAGQILPWTQLTGQESGFRSNEFLSGEIHTSHERYLAVKAPANEQGESIVFCLPTSSLVLSSDKIQESMLSAGVLTFCWTLAPLSILAFLVMSRVQYEHARTQSQQDDHTWKQERDLIRTRDAVIFGLAKLAESRDPETGQHLERITQYSTRLATAARRHPRFSQEITPQFIRLLELSSALHDIGKVGVEDAILLKPGRLTHKEREQMQEHAASGGHCIAEIERRLGESNFLEMAREIALHHHEWWNGNGYPLGLKGTEIPLSARLVAIADVYDALSSRRVYKEPYGHERCVGLIVEGTGTQFDPDLVEIFLEIQDQFRTIADRYSDTHGDSEEENNSAKPQPFQSTLEQVLGLIESPDVLAVPNTELSFKNGPQVNSL